jgi:hypothetical protein
LGYLITWIIKKSTEKFEKKYDSELTKKSKVNALVFGRELFDKDIIELRKRTNLKLYIFPNEYYTMFADAILPNNLRHQLRYHLKSDVKKYESSDITACVERKIIDPVRDEKARKKMDHVVANIKQIIISNLDLNCMITANINFYQDQSWQNAFRDNNLRVFVIFKEFFGTINSRREAIITGKELGLKFEGDLIFVFCEWAKEILLDSGEAEESKILVSGAPRTDVIYDLNKNHRRFSQDNTKVVVLFDFFETENELLLKETLEIFSKLSVSKKYGKILFLIKTKSDNHSKSLIQFCEKNNIHFPKVEITSILDQKYILENALCFIGYQTSALVEYMITDKAILSLHWAESLNDPDKNMFNDENPAYILIKGKDHFERTLSKVIDYDIKVPNNVHVDRNNIIKKFLHKIDGKRSKNIADMIEKHTRKFI